ncbi:hypothetical protein BDP81DRAFT_83421 [Colletotrichum phormii]|uniref:Uncharacterized protein n=1 Tax=Colletotrichum phormii TaxID=359342 RepID=A0AAJ0A1X6_9PEZI|nr:uncharacterized protein BDP81DRAFT_83421 [Colletotrichum phormii]KAK1654443.1 hypothetical protein BDP81DRAFT_83421 [Colletotrichum phormii]
MWKTRPNADTDGDLEGTDVPSLKYYQGLGQHYPLSASFSNQSVLVFFDSFGVQCACRCRCRCSCRCLLLVARFLLSSASGLASGTHISGVRLTERRERILLCRTVGLTLAASLSDGRTVRVSIRCRRLGLALLSLTTAHTTPPQKGTLY